MDGWMGTKFVFLPVFAMVFFFFIYRLITNGRIIIILKHKVVSWQISVFVGVTGEGFVPHHSRAQDMSKVY